MQGVKFQIYFIFALTSSFATSFAKSLGTVKIAISTLYFFDNSLILSIQKTSFPLIHFPIFCGALSNIAIILSP